MVSVKVLKLGSSPVPVNVVEGSLIQDVLNSAGIDPHGYSISLNGLGATTGTSVENGDVITMNPKIEAGNI